MALLLGNVKSYTMRPGEFLWGFDPGPPHALSPSTLGCGPRSPQERLVTTLLAELARAGWDVPGIDVTVDVYDGEARGLFRYVSKVIGQYRGLPFELDFSGKMTTGYDFLPGRFAGIKIGDWSTSADVSRWPPDRMDLFEDILLSSIFTASVAPPSPGAERITREGDANIVRLFHCDPMPSPAGFPVLYCWVPSGLLHRRPDGLILTSTGTILVSDSSPEDIPFLPERRYDTFDYASPDIRIKADQGAFPVSEKSVPVEVKLRDLNEIYVMDMAARDEARAKVDAAIRASGRRESTREEINEVNTAAAKTMVPAAGYSGDFRKPIYAIGRHLMEDEARFMKGPVRVVFDEGVLAITMTDIVSDRTVVFQSCDNAGVNMFNNMMRDAEALSYQVGSGFVIDANVLDEMETRRARAAVRRQAQGRTP